jgi:hypothetical protein
MRPSGESEPSPPPSDERQRLSGQRFVIAAFAISIGVAAIVVLVAALAVVVRGDADTTCQEEPAVCTAVRGYTVALNERDADGLLNVLTDSGLRSLLNVTSEEELEQRLQLLSPADRMEGIEITQMSIERDSAIVVAVFTQRDEEFTAIYQLVRSDGRWLIDG